jgi:hypothetical protein
VSLVGAWLGGQRFEIPIAYASWRDRAKVHHERIVYAHCIDFDWPWWYPVTDEELALCSKES